MVSDSSLGLGAGSVNVAKIMGEFASEAASTLLLLLKCVSVESEPVTSSFVSAPTTTMTAAMARKPTAFLAEEIENSIFFVAISV